MEVNRNYDEFFVALDRYIEMKTSLSADVNQRQLSNARIMIALKLEQVLADAFKLGQQRAATPARYMSANLMPLDWDNVSDQDWTGYTIIYNFPKGYLMRSDSAHPFKPNSDFNKFQRELTTVIEDRYPGAKVTINITDGNPSGYQSNIPRTGDDEKWEILYRDLQNAFGIIMSTVIANQ